MASANKIGIRSRVTEMCAFRTEWVLWELPGLKCYCWHLDHIGNVLDMQSGASSQSLRNVACSTNTMENILGDILDSSKVYKESFLCVLECFVCVAEACYYVL